MQTCSPDNYILRYAVSYDYNGFFENEIGLRKATSFPPYSLICRVMVTSESNDKALQTLKEVYLSIEKLREAPPQEVLFLNKMHSPVKRIQGKHRYQVLMRLTGKSLIESVYAVAAENTTADCLVYVEENPANLS